jgi:hypothetical protein
MGTARAPVVGSGSCPPCNAIESKPSFLSNVSSHLSRVCHSLPFTVIPIPRLRERSLAPILGWPCIKADVCATPAFPEMNGVTQAPPLRGSADLPFRSAALDPSAFLAEKPQT